MVWLLIPTLLSAASIVVLSSGVVRAQEIQLDGIVVTVSKIDESAIDALAGASTVSKETLDTQFQADSVSKILNTIPGVATQETARDTAQAVNIRGLQDFGRVNVLIEGARQNFQRSGHSANGTFYVEPEMLQRVEVTRGPTATIYGSGAIGGVVAFELLDADSILKPGEYAAIQSRTRYASNGDGKLASGTGAIRVGNFDIVGQINGRWNRDYEDGDGVVVPGSNDETGSGMVKARWRPAEGHEITGTIVDFNSKFVDQAEAGGSLRDTDVDNTQFTLGYTFSRPDTPLLDFSAKVYKNRTNMEQTRLTSSTVPIFGPNPAFPPVPPPFTIIGFDTFPAGASRNFTVDTEGVDVFNTSRFEFGSARMALTYGADAFRDEVSNYDLYEGGDELTPSGKRTVYGSFIQSHWTFFDRIDLIGALRYDNYEIKGGTTNLSDDRVSPKITAGVTPVEGFTLFATYAEGFRAPAVTETLISGLHAPPANFNLIPNPNLRPEVAHNVEGGVNLKYNGVLKQDDAFRAKFTAFRNKVDDYIDQVYVEGPNPAPVFLDDTLQYQNVRNATLEGVEFEAAYDARSWFLGLSAHHIRGTNDDTGEGLYSVPADQIILTVGFRAFDEKLTAGARARFVGKQDRFVEGETAASAHADAYQTLDLFAQYEVNEIATLNLNIDNVFDETYRQHTDQYNSPGFSARVGLTMRLGAD
ncbi:TonB-denpendent receptor [Candidatus Filomicrobium marinum]|uniref:TonB-denpendent receptor n=2 Tax=Filomicrobium TaxID=119044 RepID=A0A0D6JG44_9HYPH|nr:MULTISPECIES: TonB-dependent hemoglobin/transferrin/lactoferrin family receptor [Filomicrobium]CFX25820.1 TonB-denpendent receptor [Candidatus Filomicrobium marinum]CPR19354.1 TonB-denpendent receptor [Candidatus Filomicrobium marinum]SDO08357.1 hemoglobin/transferrin/lactoferrin receptor protein [Filomicrobium insigne]